jgi:glycerol dehydrogenase
VPPSDAPPPLRTLLAPARYVQGRGAVERLGEQVAPLGATPLVVADDTVWSVVGDAVTRSFAAAGLPLVRDGFGTLATADAVERLTARVRATGADVAVAIGGGSVIDAVKAAADDAGVRCVVVPTVASTDGPCSAQAVLYADDGTLAGYRHLPRNPDLVLVDTQLVAGAPVRFLVAGIGDALSTWVEARAVARGGATTLAGGPPTATATALARLSWDLLHAHAPAAVAAVRERRVTDAVEQVVEAGVLLSGLGFESGGLAAAHAIHNGLTTVPQTRGLAHGAKVNLGTVTQLVLEGAPDDELHGLVRLTARLGLPTTLAEVGLPVDDVDLLARVARAATAEGESIHAMPFAVDAADVVDALRSADGIARRVRAEAGLPEPVPHRAG